MYAKDGNLVEKRRERIPRNMGQVLSFEPYIFHTRICMGVAAPYTSDDGFSYLLFLCPGWSLNKVSISVRIGGQAG